MIEKTDSFGMVSRTKSSPRDWVFRNMYGWKGGIRRRGQERLLVGIIAAETTEILKTLFLDRSATFHMCSGLVDCQVHFRGRMV